MLALLPFADDVDDLDLLLVSSSDRDASVVDAGVVEFGSLVVIGVDTVVIEIGSLIDLDTFCCCFCCC